ncbi:G-D-S-L family lipolytic protein [Flavobacterium rhamnosiphilum]|uniref:G-D-S-L family lipolytic protein n=1 Tax=Flavobacterium rhamnosiphilum TaxID=2541724 RepID=A0A4R5FCJ2_9FLAO|nr:G-D-S-L family lipolytic protein [Flavobacterium rhamnosiphilum]TDE46505.1 G-D-S-L family lipolytic protein [Flavobacterium rhamnosiphilum]
MIKKFKWLLLVSLTFVACNSDDETIVVSNSSDGLPLTAGSADFSKYVALGDSFAAGYSDGALFVKGQEGAYPNVLAQQFALVGGGAFVTPLMADNIGGFSLAGSQIPQFGRRMYFGKATNSDFDEPIAVSGVSSTDVSARLSGAYNNLGVAGAKCIQLVTPGFGSSAGNPYFARFASSASTTVLADALTQNPTFFSLWIGGNDVLGYALAGGDATINPLTPSTGGIGVGFDASYNELVNKLTTGGRKGVIANLPYITALPQFAYLQPSFVDTFKYYPDGDEKLKTRVVSAGDVATINSINSILGFLDQVLTAYGQGSRINVLSSATGATNPVLIKDETLVNYSAQITGAAAGSGNPMLMALANYLGATFGKVRQTATGDLIPLVSSSVIGTAATLPPGVPSNLGAYGITYPLEDKHILIPSEISEIIAATDAYNLTIKAVADAKGLAFVDTKAIMNQLVNGGISANGFTVTATFVTGGGFSLDGIHPSPRGYALIANKFIEAINTTYGSNLKGVDLSNYRILFPSTL